MEEELKKKIIKVANIEKKEGAKNGVAWAMFKITDANNNKYAFFQKKKDGSETKAYEKFVEQSVNAGSDVGIAFSEKQVEFKSPKGGETVKYIQRNIAYLSDRDKLEGFLDLEPKTELQFDKEISVDDIPF